MSQRNWRVFDYKYGVILSPSQGETFAGCNRKWWFQKVLRLPEPPFQASRTGDAFHKLCEDYLNGIDDPAALDEWLVGLTALEIVTLTKALREMIAKGVLRRDPALKVEKPIQLVVLPNRQAALIGYADALAPGRVEDHKTTKDHKWLATEEDLKRDFAMLCYAADALEEGKDEVVLRHNQVVLNPQLPDALATEAVVTRAAIKHHWQEVVQKMAREMLALKTSGTPAADWKSVPGPDNPQKTCRAYGRKCSFYAVCHEGLSPADFRARQGAL